MSTPLSSAPSDRVGIDVGATLCKLAREGKKRALRHLPSAEIDVVREQVEGWRPREIVATGGGADRLGPEIAGVSVQRVPEFEAWARGAPILAERERLELPDRYLLVSLGTGTSVLAIEGDECSRVGGSALGGGTLLGLGRLLLDMGSFRQIADLAQDGDRRRVDLLVGDIYRGVETPLPRDLTASSFGKIESREPADLAHALMGLLGENLALICGELARSRDIADIVFCGSTLSDNPVLVQNLDLVSRTYGREPHFLRDGAFCGAVGATALAQS